MQVRICKKVLFLECAASLLLMTSTTITAYAQGDVEEAIAGLINPNITTIYNAKRII